MYVYHVCGVYQRKLNMILRTIITEITKKQFHETNYNTHLLITVLYPCETKCTALHVSDF